MRTVTFSKPLTIGEGASAKTLESLSMDLETMTGADLIFCTHEAEAAKGEMVRVIMLDQELHLQIAAKASGIAPADLKRLSMRDYVEVVTAVQGFLTGSA